MPSLFLLRFRIMIVRGKSVCLPFRRLLKPHTVSGALRLSCSFSSVAKCPATPPKYQCHSWQHLFGNCHIHLIRLNRFRVANGLLRCLEQFVKLCCICAQKVQHAYCSYIYHLVVDNACGCSSYYIEGLLRKVKLKTCV
jgi:hypothetical protein